MCEVFQPKDVAVSSASSLLFPFGSPNTMGVGALCYVSMAMIAPHVTRGGLFINMFSDLEQAELIVVWGANPTTDCPPLDYKRIIEAVRRDAALVVIDSRRTLTAKIEGAQWLPIRPGTDGALALAMCQVIIAEELYDESFVRDWTYGFDEFGRYVQHFPPEMVEGITGVPAEACRALARRLAQANGASPVMYTGLEYSDSGVQAIRATMVLWALAGQLDVPGGRCFTMKENLFPINRSGLIPNPEVKLVKERPEPTVMLNSRDAQVRGASPTATRCSWPVPGAGTENTPGIIGLGVAAALVEKRLAAKGTTVRELRENLWQGLKTIFPEARLNGPEKGRLPNTLNITLPGLRGDSLVMTLDQQGISFSSGSACRSGSPRPSHALLALGLSEEETYCTIRLSLGVDTTREGIARTMAAFERVKHETAATVRFVPCR